MTSGGDWYVVRDEHLIDSPALLVYRQRVVENIRRLTTMFDDLQWLRPHVKTHKTREVTALMLSAGITRFKCATIAEAEMLAMCGAPDVLLAYPVCGPKLSRLIALVKKYPDTIFSFLADDPAAAQAVSAAAAASGIVLRLYVDLNVGTNRTGILPGEAALHFYEICARLPNLVVAGLHVYDGHIKDKDPGKRKAVCDEAFAPVEQMRKVLQEKGFAPRIVAGGSPSFPAHRERKNVECSPGTFVYWDKGYSESFPDLDFLPAALVLTRVISVPTPHSVCLDLGHKSIAAENDLLHRFQLLNAPEFTPVSQSEEHVVLQSALPHSRRVGEVLYALPFHVCPTSALYGSALVIEEGVQTDSWRILSRERMITI